MPPEELKRKGGTGGSACSSYFVPRPGPVFRAGHHAGRHGVLFDVTTDAIRVLGFAHPVVPGLVLPERLSGAGRETVGSSCSRAFEPAGDTGDRYLRRNQMEFIELTLGSSS